MVFKRSDTAKLNLQSQIMELSNNKPPEKLPYEKLALLGLDREKVDKLPREVQEKLFSGEVTPLMQISINAKNGQIITLPLKLQVVTDRNGDPLLQCYPVKGGKATVV